MFTAVIVINLTICLLCFFVAWKVWKLRQALGRVADTLIEAERHTHAVLYGAPNAIIKGRRGTRGLRNQYGRLNARLVKVQQILAVMTLLLGIRRRFSRGSKQLVSKRY